jgi:hypothetical protein
MTDTDALIERLNAKARELGMLRWRPTEMQLLREAAVALTAAEERAGKAQREADLQMGSKLEAQVALQAITKALCLRLDEIGNGWTEGAQAILARIEVLVDEGERGFTEREEAERENARLREALADTRHVLRGIPPTNIERYVSQALSILDAALVAGDAGGVVGHDADG